MSSTHVEIDGSIGEGGGQILRSALALSLVTGKPVCIDSIRAGRGKPGLLSQHLTAVQAAVDVGRAQVEGASLGSRQLTFEPSSIRSGSYSFSVGTAGSSTLVFQTILPALITADGSSELVLEGGTHNPFAPPFEFIDRVLLPVLRRMGAQVTAKLERPGFYPAGGGRWSVEIRPASRLAPIDLLVRGEIVRHRATALVSNLPRHIAERELAAVRKALNWDAEWLRSEEIRGAAGPGNVLILEVESEQITEVFTGFGRKGVSAERVAQGVVREVREYLGADAPVGPHLADQLLVPLALAGGGSFTTVAPTRHTSTNIEIVRAFLDVGVSVKQESSARWRIDIRPVGQPG